MRTTSPSRKAVWYPQPLPSQGALCSRTTSRGTGDWSRSSSPSRRSIRNSSTNSSRRVPISITPGSAAVAEGVTRNSPRTTSGTAKADAKFFKRAIMDLRSWSRRRDAFRQGGDLGRRDRPVVQTEVAQAAPEMVVAPEADPQRGLVGEIQGRRVRRRGRRRDARPVDEEGESSP